MVLPINPTDAQTLLDAGKLLVWGGKQLKVWIEARQAAEPDAKPTTTQKKKTAPDVAIVVRISRMNVEDVRHYLDTHKIKADLIVISNTTSDEAIHLPSDADAWEEMVREFYTAFTKIQAQSGAKRFHIFLSAPAALAFAMGCTMSTLYDVRLYQWDIEQHVYFEAIRGASRKRLMSPSKGSAH